MKMKMSIVIKIEFPDTDVERDSEILYIVFLTAHSKSDF